VRPTAVIAAVLLIWTTAAVAGDEPGRWSETAEFSFVATGGNTESSSLAFKNTLIGSWGKNAITVRASAVRVDTEERRIAVERPSGQVTVESPDSQKALENYALNARYDRTIRKGLFWFAGTGWDRNEPAGVRGRYVAELGVGKIWKDEENLKFKTSCGATVTRQNDVTGVDERFGGLRISWDYSNQFGRSTTYTNVLIVDQNLDETSDWRADMQNGLAAAISKKLALKVGLQLLYDNEPASEELDLCAQDGTPIGEITVPLDELDTIFTVSLVVNFK